MSDETTGPGTAYFLGVRPGDRAGHHVYRPGYQHAVASDPVTPWAGDQAKWADPLWETTALTAAWGADHRRETQPEGVARFDRRDGWTLVALWDRSADRRGGCCALFALSRTQHLDDRAALALARALFPEVFARIEAHLGRQVVPDRPPEVAPEAPRCPACRRPL